MFKHQLIAGVVAFSALASGAAFAQATTSEQVIEPLSPPANSMIVPGDKAVVVVPATVVPGPPGDECHASQYQHFVGEKSPEITLPAGTNFRHYRKGDPLTMDLQQDRLNFEYDRTGKLVAVSCG
ncbi:MAG: hypothetical protein DI498_01360 [Paracoccus denitrificans]|nr:MAG: hypothetical protein DI498_01360 [Paracoccus denitrificans]PZO85816.1 MAG: hypothetical protein DI633_01360 [Paracoccus denitrificans]